MEEAGWLAPSWGESENNRKAKYYRLTAAGRRQAQAETEEWQRISLAIAAALEATRHALDGQVSLSERVSGTISPTGEKWSANWTRK